MLQRLLQMLNTCTSACPGQELLLSVGFDDGHESLRLIFLPYLKYLHKAGQRKQDDCFNLHLSSPLPFSFLYCRPYPIKTPFSQRKAATKHKTIFQVLCLQTPPLARGASCLRISPAHLPSLSASSVCVSILRASVPQPNRQILP